MKILLITHYYKHKNAMASVRFIKLAKYFAQEGADVTVLTSMQKDNWCKQEMIPELSSNIREVYAPEHNGMKWLRKVYELAQKRGKKRLKKIKDKEKDINNKKATSSQVKIGILQNIKNNIAWLYYYTCDRLENYFLYKGLINEAKKINLKDFDYVIATYPGAGVHDAGVWIKKTGRAKKFVADYRDPAYNPGGRSRKIEAIHDKKVQDRAVYASDFIVCVSKGMAETLIAQYKEKKIAPVFVVNNGYDLEDHITLENSFLDKDKFNFVYTGALYNGRRTVEMLAEVLKEILEEGVIKKNELRIHYAGSDYLELLSQLKPYGLEEIAIDHGYVTRSESLAMQKEADVVLLLNWNQDNYTGVIPGKLYEYMASKRIICALIMGNQSGSETAKMIREGNLGCACEEVEEKDKELMKQYMVKLFEKFKSGEHIQVESDNIQQYEYSHLAKKYLTILSMKK